MGKWLLSYWRGEKPLWKSFWLIWLIGGFINYNVSCFIASQFTLAGPIGAYILGLILILPYTVFAFVSVWRSAKNTVLGEGFALGVKGMLIFLIIFYTFTAIEGMRAAWHSTTQPENVPSQTQQIMHY